MKKVKDIMVTSPKYIGKHETLQTVAEYMSKSNLGSLLVVDEKRKLVGIITDRDITISAGLQEKNLSEIMVRDIIEHKKLYTVSPDDNIDRALEIMRTEKVGRLPVVDRDQNIRGIVSLNHIVRKTHGGNDQEEIGYKGKENVMSTLHSLANRTYESVFETQEERMD